MESFRKLRSRLPQRSKGSAPTSSAPDESPTENVTSSPSMPKPQSKGRPKGLIILSDFIDSDEGSSKADIIAIHGLNGHALNTWTDGDTVWFRDLLPSLVPSASLRVSTYGYSSEIASSGAKGQMLDFVLGLLSALETLRRSTDTVKVPMFFICHSLGGILFKKCLLMAHERKELYGSIVTSIRGVAFFGTPHRGSGCASLSKICLDIGHVFYPNLRSDLVQNLKRTATELADISCSAPELLQPLSIVTAYETRPLELFTVAGIIVGRETALLNLTNEMAIPIDADHRSLCRFSDPADPTFRPVLLAIADVVNKMAGISTTSYQEFLDALYFDEFQQRRLLLPDSHAGTFTWIWNHERFKEWTDGGSKMLWIQGKPASGKSTMMKFIREGLERQCRASLVQPSKRRGNPGRVADPEHIVVDFFYSVRGSNLQQEHVWMLRSILWQIMRQIPSLWPKFVLFLQRQPGYQDFTRKNGKKQSSNLSQWSQWISVEKLQSLLGVIGSQHKSSSKITIYVLVDAMDESEIQNRRRIATSLLQLASHPEQHLIKFKVLVASRPDPTTNVVSERCIRMNFEAQTDKDIKVFVEKSLESLAEQVPSLQDGDLSLIQETLQVKSQGVFLWVKLILLEFEEKFHNEGCTIREMEDILISIPPGLDSLYEWMFLTISSQTATQRRETDSMLSWTAEEPMSHEMMNDIVAIAACGEYHLTQSTLSRNRLSSDSDIEKRVSSRCFNFLEWTSTQESLSVCQFIHTTALQFITEKLDYTQKLVEDQAFKYAQFVASSDPSWLLLIESWPDFEVEQLKSVNLGAVLDLFDDLTLPIFWYMLKSRGRNHGHKPSLDSPFSQDVFPHVKPSSALSWKLCIALSLAAAVQADHLAFCALGRYCKSSMLEHYCFNTSSSSGEPYTSFSVRCTKEWFDVGDHDARLTRYKQNTLFCDLMSVLSMFSGPDKLDQICATAKTQDWYSPCPGDSGDLFWFLSAARQGNSALVQLYFKESRNGTSRMPFIRDWAGTTYPGLKEQLSNIISIAIDYGQIHFANMMFEEEYVEDIEYVDTPDEEGRTALDRACGQNLVVIAKGIYPRYINPKLDEAGVEKLWEKARENAFMEIARLFEDGGKRQIEELG